MEHFIKQIESETIVSSQLDERKGRLHVEFGEDVTSTHVQSMRKELRNILDSTDSSAWKSLYVDMRNCRMVDSMGVNWLFAEQVRLKEIKKEMVVRISSPAIDRVMKFAGLDKLVTLKYRRRKQTR